MSITTIIIFIFIFGFIIGGVLLLKRTAKKFNLTKQQLNKIKERNKELDNEDK